MNYPQIPRKAETGMKLIIWGGNVGYLLADLLPYLSLADQFNWIDDQLEWLMAEAHTHEILVET